MGTTNATLCEKKGRGGREEGRKEASHKEGGVLCTLVVKVRLKGAAESPLQPVEREAAELVQELLKDSTDS